MPLTFSADTHQPALFKGLAVAEFTRWIADDVHGLGKLMFANGVPYRFTARCVGCTTVAQVSKPAVSPISKSAGRYQFERVGLARVCGFGNPRYSRLGSLRHGALSPIQSTWQ